MRDYADACFRYLRYTGLVSIAHKSRTISIFADKAKDVEFILSTVDRNPVFVDDVDRFKAHLFDANVPALYADNKDNIVDIILRMSNYTKRELIDLDIDALKTCATILLRGIKKMLYMSKWQKLNHMHYTPKLLIHLMKLYLMSITTRR